MADMDSPGARSRQAPATVRRNTAPARRATTPRPVVSTPKKPRKKRTSYSSNNDGNYRRRSNNNDSYRSRSLQKKGSGRSDNNYRRRSSSGNDRPKPTRKTTPTVPAKPDAKVIKPVAPPKPPGNATWLRSDPTYQRQMAAYQKALADYQADQTLQRGDYETGYLNTKRDIGLAKEDALESLENDYAARGLLRSSLYNTDVGELNQQYQNQYTDLDKQRTAFLDQLAQGLTGFRNEQSIQQQNAQAEALRRRAEKYNL